MPNLIKEAFAKVKQDISRLEGEISFLTTRLDELKRTLNQTDKPLDSQTDKKIYQTQPLVLSDTPIAPQEIKGLKSPNTMFSIGNDGVQTDRQTDRQTDQQDRKFVLDNKNNQDSIAQLEKVAEIVNSLDALKRDLRRQFKKITSQEMFIFITLYQLQEEGIEVDYSRLAKKTKLSESSIRDYIQKLLKKGIPLEKHKENNKKITLSIPPEFKRIASLETIIALRSL